MGGKRKTNAAKAKREKMLVSADNDLDTGSAVMEADHTGSELCDCATCEEEKAKKDAGAVQESLELAYGQIDPTEDDTPFDHSGSPSVDASEAKPKNSWRVTLITDMKIDFPELWLDVYLAGDLCGNEKGQFAELFTRAACMRADSPDRADLVVFTGGPDIDPQYYGVSDIHKKTRVDDERDHADLMLYLKCWEEGIPMLGICRGAQFLHAMNGGKLFQDVDEHNRSHPIYDVIQSRTIAPTSSVHHQMCIENPQGGMTVLAVADVSRNRWRDSITKEGGKQKDIEAFFYRETCCLGVQGHPEYKGYHAYSKWCLDQIQRHVVENPDINFCKEKDGHRRMLPDLLGQRTQNQNQKGKK